MIEGLLPYAEYKDSGQEWLGRLPSHWSLLPNRVLFQEVKDRNHPSEEMLSVTITRGIVRQKSLLSDTAKKDSSNLNKAAYKLVQSGDIAYNKMRAWQGALGASSLRGIISPAYIVMRPRAVVSPAFYHHLYRTPAFAKEAERWSYGITSDMWSGPEARSAEHAGERASLHRRCGIEGRPDSLPRRLSKTAGKGRIRRQNATPDRLR